MSGGNPSEYENWRDTQKLDENGSPDASDGEDGAEKPQFNKGPIEKKSVYERMASTLMGGGSRPRKGFVNPQFDWPREHSSSML